MKNASVQGLLRGPTPLNPPDRCVLDGTFRAYRKAHELQNSGRDRAENREWQGVEADHLLILTSKGGQRGLEEEGIHGLGGGWQWRILDPLDRLPSFISHFEFCSIVSDGGYQ